MSLLLLPALDIADGRVVPGNSAETEASPQEIALAWQTEGAEWLHLVDLDAAFGRGTNTELLAAIVATTDVRVEVSAGVHDDESLARVLQTGCDRVVVRTPSPVNLEWCAQTIATLGERIAVALDVHVMGDPDGVVHYRLGARGASAMESDLWETMRRLDQAGCARYIVTDVGRDGALGGPNVALYEALVGETNTPLIASGGVASIDDLQTLATCCPRLEGVIVGKALHRARFTLGEAVSALRNP